MNAKGRVCLLVSDFDAGGVERTFCHLASGLASHGIDADFLIGKSEGPYLGEMPERVTIHFHPKKSVEEMLECYLRLNKPDVVLTGKIEDDFSALRFRSSLSDPFRLFFQVGTPLSEMLRSHYHFGIKRLFRKAAIRRSYQRADGIIAVSKGVAEDLLQNFGIHREKIHHLNNPVLPADFQAKVTEPCAHPWFTEGAPPVILSVGGLRKVKDFPTLVRAFQLVRRQVDCRLVILGEGRQRKKILELANALDVGQEVDLPGFIENPYPYMKRCAVFVLSSRREGFGNVLVEALASGAPVISTDCPCGPREVLQEGRIGRLVSVGKPDPMAEAILELLQTPPMPKMLQDAAEPFSVWKASEMYLTALGLCR